MKKNNGFTIIELMIVIAIVGIVGLLVFNGAMGYGSSSSISYGFNGVTETRCIDGYKFVIGQNGHINQMLDTGGKGIACN